jgi:hypothetical protein
VYTYQWDDIITLARTYADERQTGFLTATELDRIANAKARVLHARAIDRGCAQHKRTYSWTATSGVSAWSDTVVCGTSMIRLEALQVVWTTTDVETLRRISTPAEDADIRRCTWGQHTPKGYVDNGSEVQLVPTPNANASMRTWFWVPWVSKTYSGTSSQTCVEPEAFDECLALELAITIRRMSDQDTVGLERSLADSLRRFDMDASMRSNAEPERIHDDAPEGQNWSSDLYLPRA